MYKKILAVFALTAVLSSCGNTTPETSAENTEETSVSASATEAVTENNTKATQTETTSASTETTAVSSSAAAATQKKTETTTAAPEETEPPTLPEDYQMSDEETIFIAKELYDAACQMSWDFHVGCPYNLDYNTYTENEYGWQYYLIIDSGVNSLADVEADYYTVFSNKYPNDLNEIFIEYGGRLYALAAKRGKDIYYDRSEIKNIVSRSDDEIVFNVESFYLGDDYTESQPYSVEKEFSVVIDEDGNWYAGLFTLPY